MSRLITFFLSFMFILSCTAQVSNEDLLVEVEKLYEEGKYEQAAETIDKLVTQGGESELVFYYGACTWSLVGNKEKALSYLEKAVDAGWLDKELISSDTDLDAIRSDNKYTRIMAVLDAKLAAVEASFPVEHKPLEIIVLPEPHYSGDLSVEEALQQRRSRRRYAENPLTLADVSQILWAAYGLTRPLPDAPAFLRGGLKTAPSAGALYPLEIYVATRNVQDLPPGVYKYQSEGHKLFRIKNGDISQQLAVAALDQPWVEEAACNIIYSAVYSRTTDKYGDRGRERYVCMDLGHSAENIYLQCESLNLSTVAIGAFLDLKVKMLINMTREEEPLYIMPIGPRL